MTKLVCDFQIDGSTYCVTARFDARGKVTGIAPVTNDKGAHAAAVFEKAAVLGALIDGDARGFDMLCTLDRPGPIAGAIIAAVERKAEVARASLKSFGVLACEAASAVRHNDGADG